jgi:ABC-type methionine transport system ATPase subunit
LIIVVILFKNKISGEITFCLNTRTQRTNPLKTVIMAFAVHHGDDAILHNCIRRTERLLEINLIISAALNKAIGKIENEFPKEMKIIKSELQSEVQATLGAMHAKYEEEKKIDEEVNKAAKELEWAKDLYG